MGNTPNWFNNVSPWGKRAPRQDRRVVVNGKFVEQTEPIQPAPETEESNTALEVVQEPAAGGVNEPEAATAERVVAANPVLGMPYGIGTTGLRKYAEDMEAANVPTESEKLQAELEPIDAVAEHEKGSQTIAEIAEVIDKEFKISPLPPADEAWQFLESAQSAAEIISGSTEPVAVLPETSEGSTGKDVLAGPDGRVEETEK